MADEAKHRGRVAILLIHGIGEQRPMGTLKGFVESLLSTRDEEDRDLYSRPDSVSGSFELRSYATRSTPTQPRLHFFEFYWAHHMATSTLGQMTIWISQIFLRWPWSVPARNLLPWLVVWALALGIGALVYCLSTADFSGWALVGVAAFAALVIRRIAETVMTDWIGDAARYLSATPKNVAVRQTIRAAGIDLLDKLHRDGRYDRIIVVGHSLGSVIAVDILHHYWYRARVQGKLENGNQTAFKTLEARLQAGEPTSWAELQPLQRALFAEMRANGLAWRVSDLLTLGSPLSSYEFLTGVTDGELELMRKRRELPQCPPVLDEGKLAGPAWKDSNLLIAHHGAVFAATCWTNHFFPYSGFKGDPIGGPLAPRFGAAIRDVDVACRCTFSWMSHTAYWKQCDKAPKPENDALTLLLRSLDLESTSQPPPANGT